jgi:hypothetical protein
VGEGSLYWKNKEYESASHFSSAKLWVRRIEIITMVVFLVAGAAAMVFTTITKLLRGRGKKTMVKINDFVKFDTTTSEDDILSSLLIWSNQIRDHPTPDDYLDIVLNSMDTYYVSRYSGSLPQLPADIDDEDYW